jgi:hypothetical protein
MKISKELFYDERYPTGLGCLACPDHKICGGIKTATLYDCFALCCNDPKKCDYACPKDLENFMDHFQDIGGYTLENIPRVRKVSYPSVSSYIPLIYNSYSRQKELDCKVVAIQLSQLTDNKKKCIKFKTKQAVFANFGVNPDAELVITGVDEDVPLEKYWFLRQSKEFFQDLKKLQPILVTSPNFSSFSNAPRTDNMFNLKRTAICWNELVSEGIPTSFHINARTPKDWERVFTFINERDELQSISFEFATLYENRKDWYLEKLLELRNKLNRELQLVIRGGFDYLQILGSAYKNLVYIDTDAFVRSIRRRKMIATGKKTCSWISVASPDLFYVDELMIENIRARAELVRNKMSAA